MLFYAQVSEARIVHYQLDIGRKIVNFNGKDINTIAINNQIPAPTLEAQVGDILEVTVNNQLEEETSVHWHGVLLPNDQDGVPYLTTPPIPVHGTFTYRFKITHPGTYWYHSHSGLQEQRGLYGALVFHPNKKEAMISDRDQVIVFSDWTNEHPKQVLANIKKDGDYYALKKDSVQSWLKILQHGWPAIKSRLQGVWHRMGPMDISDIGYDAFLANGQTTQIIAAKPGDKIRLRLINAAASSYFFVEFAGSPMQVVAADGVDVEPLLVQRLRMAIAETYDVIVTIPKDGMFELRASAEDGTGFSSTWIGQGAKKIDAPDIAKPNLFIMNHSQHGPNHRAHAKNKQQDEHIMQHTGHHHHSKSERKMIENMVDYRALRALKETRLPADSPTTEIWLNLTGNMERYVWSFNNTPLKDASPILIKQGENIRLILNNQTMMHHPIHLHGHFFRVLNGQKEKSPLKHTVDVPAMGRVDIEFAAQEEKDWFFHCHNLYHMISGMARVFSYDTTTRYTTQIQNKISHDPWYHKIDISFLSQMSLGDLRFSNTKNAIALEYDTDYKKEYDIDILYLRTISRYLDLYFGGTFEKETDAKGENSAIAGFRYILPLLVEFEFRIDHQAQLRAQLGSELHLTDRLMFEWFYNTDKEYRTSLSYELSKSFLLSTAYDSDHHWGAGIRFRL